MQLILSCRASALHSEHWNILSLILSLSQYNLYVFFNLILWRTCVGFSPFLTTNLVCQQNNLTIYLTATHCTLLGLGLASCALKYIKTKTKTLSWGLRRVGFSTRFWLGSCLCSGCQFLRSWPKLCCHRYFVPHILRPCPSLLPGSGCTTK